MAFSLQPILSELSLFGSNGCLRKVHLSGNLFLNLRITSIKDSLGKCHSLIPCNLLLSGVLIHRTCASDNGGALLMLPMRLCLIVLNGLLSLR